jgi:polyhydroxyalkanoate synthase subunit PhaC
MNLAANLEIIPNLMQSYVTGFQLNSIYNSIYFMAFREVYNKSNGNIITKSAVTFYNDWLRLLDKELDIKLKSSSFTSLLSRYVNLLVELRTILREAGYPVYYIGWLFDSYVRNIMVFASTEKDFDLAPFDIMSVKAKTRLLHYHNNIGAKDEDKRHTLLIICAPINRFHIKDISQDRSVVKSLLSKGLDVHMLDWGYPIWEDSSLIMLIM